MLLCRAPSCQYQPLFPTRLSTDGTRVSAGGKTVDTTALAAQTTEVGPVPLAERLFTLPALLALGLLVTLAGPALLLAQRYPGWRRWLHR